MSTCMGCLKDYEDDDLIWEGGLLCANCKDDIADIHHNSGYPDLVKGESNE